MPYHGEWRVTTSRWHGRLRRWRFYTEYYDRELGWYIEVTGTAFTRHGAERLGWKAQAALKD